jgi:hypothetical protein
MEAPHLYYFLAKLHATAAALEECPQWVKFYSVANPD